MGVEDEEQKLRTVEADKAAADKLTERHATIRNGAGRHGASTAFELLTHKRDTRRARSIFERLSSMRSIALRAAERNPSDMPQGARRLFVKLSAWSFSSFGAFP
jgi:hypothetical protein